MAELKQVREYAEEGLSGGRIGKLIGRTRAEVCGAAHRYGIKLKGSSGPPFGNKNRAALALGSDELKRYRRGLGAQRQQRHRQRKRLGLPAKCQIQTCERPRKVGALCRHHYLIKLRRRRDKWRADEAAD